MRILKEDISILVLHDLDGYLRGGCYEDYKL